MGRVCDICGAGWANEQFGGRGKRGRICKTCRQMPKLEQQVALAMNEIFGFLVQSRISDRNVRRLEALAALDDPSFRIDRLLMLEIARAAPFRRRRWLKLPQSHPELFDRLLARETFRGLIDEELDKISVMDV